MASCYDSYITVVFIIVAGIIITIILPLPHPFPLLATGNLMFPSRRWPSSWALKEQKGSERQKKAPLRKTPPGAAPTADGQEVLARGRHGSQHRGGIQRGESVSGPARPSQPQLCFPSRGGAAAAPLWPGLGV